MVNKEEKIKAIISACAKVNPDIMKLQFGTKVKDKLGDILTFNGERYTTFEQEYIGVLEQSDDLFIGDIEILGRPVRLADVLLAIGLERFHNNDDIPELIYGYKHSYNLLKDDIREQSDECIDFIYGLIKTDDK